MTGYSRQDAKERAARKPPATDIKGPEPISAASLSRRRIAYGWTLDDLSDMTGVAPGILHLLETGRLPSITRDEWAVVVSALRLAPSPDEVKPPLALDKEGIANTRRVVREGRRLTERARFEGVQPHPSMPWHMRLTLQRVRLGLTILDAAREAGVSQGAVRAWEAGSVPLTRTSVEGLRDLAACLRLDLPLPSVGPLPATAWVVGRGKGARLWAAYAEMLEDDTPAQAIIRARLRNGWTVARTAKALDLNDWTVAVTEQARAWPLCPSPAMRSLIQLWRVRPPVQWAEGVSCNGAEGRALKATLTERVRRAMEAAHLDAHDLGALCGLGPVAVAAATGDMRHDTTGRFWRAIGSVSQHLNILAGLTVPARYWRGELQEGEEEGSDAGEI